MKLVISILGMLAILVAAAVSPAKEEPVAPEGAKGPLKVLREPIRMEYGVSPRMAVIFNHTTHKNFKCVLCHHMETTDGKLYVPCTNDECHSIKGARERDPMSMFMAYHDPATDRSCYGCHKREAKSHPEFKGCRPCHMSPLAKAEQAKK